MIERERLHATSRATTSATTPATVTARCALSIVLASDTSGMDTRATPSGALIATYS